MNEAPIANYRHISVEQAINADKALWVKVSNETRGKLHPKAGVEKPFDAAFNKFADHPEVLQHLMPLQSHGSTRSEFTHSFSATGKGKGSYNADGKGKSSKGKGKTAPGIAVPDDCEIFVDGKQLCKRWQVEDVLQKSKRANAAWWVFTCVGRKAVTSCIRATNALTDFAWNGWTTVSLWKPRHSRFVAAPQDCLTH